jgi:hypothetical protein
MIDKIKNKIDVKTIIFLLIFGFLMAYKLERNIFPQPKMASAGPKIGKRSVADKYSGLANNKISSLENKIRNAAKGKSKNKQYLNKQLITWACFFLEFFSTQN